MAYRADAYVLFLTDCLRAPMKRPSSLAQGAAGSRSTLRKLRPQLEAAATPPAGSRAGARLRGAQDLSGTAFGEAASSTAIAGAISGSSFRAGAAGSTTQHLFLYGRSYVH